MSDFCDPMDCSLPGSSVHEILQARILEWVAIPFSRRSSQPRDWTQVYCIAGRFLTIWAVLSSVVSNSLWPYGLQHARLACPTPTPWARSNSCPSSQWCHPFHPLSFPSPPTFNLSQHWGLFPRSQFFTSGGQSIRVSSSVLPVNIQDWFPLGLTCLISLQSRRLSVVFYSTTVQKHQFFSIQVSLWSTSHIHTWLLEKP